MHRRLIAFSLSLLLALTLGVSAGRAQADDRQTTIDGWRATLGQIEASLQRADLTNAELDDRRKSAQAILTGATAFGEELKPLIAAAEQRLQSLAPREDLTADEPAAVTETRDRLQAELKTLVAYGQQADLVSLQARQLVEEIATRRSARLTTELSKRERSILSPGLWVDMAAETSSLVAGLGRIGGSWIRLVTASSDLITALLVALALALVAAILLARYLFLRWAIWSRQTDAPGFGLKLSMAVAVVIADIGVPLLILSGLTILFAELDLLPQGARDILSGVTAAAIVFATITGLTRALIAPARPTRRIAVLADPTAGRVYSFVVIGALFMALLVLIEQLAAAVAAPAFYATAVRGILAVPIAILVILAARALIRGRDRLSDEQKARTVRWRVLTPLFALAASVVIAASVIGYMSFAGFLIEQVVFVWIVLGALVILAGLADQAITMMFTDDRPAARRLARNLGLSAKAMTQIGVVASGLAHILLGLFAALVVAAPWGLDSTSITSAFAGLFYGIQVGSIRITFSTIVIALVVFIGGIALSRVFQRWLDRRFLPTTRVDPGLKNSIHTAVGYVGIIIAAVAAATYAGLDLASIAIVAGALSVGIGFGLQSIVNNFVSGLILLVERPIRAGDWIAVGSEEGTVKRISVRATEIETFERASVIIPNSSLISGTVKNMYLRDVTGRITIPVGVGYGSDPAAVREILIACAREHRLVLSEPAPFVLFMDFGASSLDFELRCFLADISNGLVVRSDLRFAILERLRAAKIEIPFPQRDVTIRGWPAGGPVAGVPPATA